MDELKIRLLGGLEVEGLDAQALGSRKARTVLKALALAGGAAVPVDRLADILWADEPPSRPADQVAVLVSRLRGVLGADRILRGDAGYSLRADWTDVDELASRVREAEGRLEVGSTAAARAAASSALALARGELLPGDDGDWVDVERQAVARLVGRARVLAAQSSLAAGDAARAAAEAEAALDRDPYDEVALQVAMTALARDGRPASALALYARSRGRLADDLGVSPTEETEALHTAVLLGEVSASDPGPAGRQTDGIVGRDDELARLDQRLAAVESGGTALVVVAGEPGIGKSTLVGAWTARVGDDAVVVTGRCEPAGRALPLQPIVDGLDALLRRLGPEVAAEVLAADPGPVTAALGRAPVDFARPGGPTEEADRQASLFAALLRVLEAAAGSHPLAVVVEDAHHADPATLAWLRFALRRGERLLAVVTQRVGEGPSLPDADPLDLGPLDLEAAIALVGAERAPELHRRSGGNPLFLLELAAAPEAVPASIRDALDARVDGLGPAAATLRAVAVLGATVDVDLLAEVLGLPVTTLLEHVETGLRVRLLAEREGLIEVAHDVVRDALAATVNAARRAHLHRSAARALTSRPRHDPMAAAWHAQQGGDVELASAALVKAAGLAAGRFDAAAAEAHLDSAVTLFDSPTARLARARVRMIRWELDAAAEDVARALAMGADVPGLELAGWVAYYRRDYVAAARYADAALERAADPTLRASCLALSGRLRHATGDLAGADRLLSEAETIAPAGTRGLPRVWLASLRVHQGRASEAGELAERALLEQDTIDHPFAWQHGLFALAYSLGLLGRPLDALAALSRLDALVAEQREQGRRFGGVAANLRGWILRSVGRLDEAADRHAIAIELPELLPFAEPRYAGLCDRVELHFAGGDLAAAAAALDSMAGIETWTGTMHWHHRQRYRLLRARLALAAGDAASAAQGAAGVALDMEHCGAPRYAALARAVEVRAAASSGERVDPAGVEQVLAAVATYASPEAWWVTAEVAAATGVDRWWRDAERHAGALVAAAGPYGDDLARYVAARLGTLRRR